MYTRVVILVPRNRTQKPARIRRFEKSLYAHCGACGGGLTTRKHCAQTERLAGYPAGIYSNFEPPLLARQVNYSIYSTVFRSCSRRTRAGRGLARDSPEQCARPPYERNRGTRTPMLSCSFQTERTWHWTWPKTPVR